MPRILPSLFRKARTISPHLGTLLPATRDLPSALNELRWIREHVHLTATGDGGNAASAAALEKRVAALCARRGRGVPLQYVLGTQPFGTLDLRCRPGVLVPRAETEAWVLHLADRLKGRARDADLSSLPDRRRRSDDQEEGGLRIVDFCTGTGCVALGLFAGLQSTHPHLHVRGVDVSTRAVNLARENLRINLEAGNLAAPLAPKQSFAFGQADVFDDEAMRGLINTGDETTRGGRGYDVVVANPPYVSRDVWAHGRGDLGYSVRKYEPSLALVPGEGVPSYEGCAHEDVFFARLLDVAGWLGARVVLFEVGDEAQAARVLQLVARKMAWRGDEIDARCEVWRDWPDLPPTDGEAVPLRVEHGKESRNVPVKGSGKVRSVLIKPDVRPHVNMSRQSL
ncbi:S-adenosyl-L-methionine-dependent methyltransferase [Sodiomyces alkalinus F11]|uniref:S-adenosyl-L-methionine-dependent methyltransferase n=1 Tax=Sodiomyces alkalinus (strain CBS 110278 / VKM F-3762 / F11) TaxID=1314773 RepID=A0A3N2PXD4_SODAK|nr:S-adenosyl-L-methionine-dependent methyltransferase [Sodiomyces alkalinus F11]ROT39147.1 S-adenosyl-L-methionine-dependent methyltransferase [Sodiomyces alkalinus F11]